jgi:hypothetical protein
MEPVFMVLGQSAGLAATIAAMASLTEMNVHDVDVVAMQRA